ncbi:MAG: LysM peptidoglycan-binding protein [Cyanobacteriota bacterium erpe_2018_sw_21hr_WHONDRS-SW48-000092_B_bin.40]|nr:LysM peptidoglycan-binding protein [Cyanobacteriota bacterium erpe_2018_sw_21hr_WHONDRS-SW48-000092_B_bin.40]
MLDSNHLPTDRTAPAALSGNSAGVQRELLEQYRIPARSNGACSLNDACSPFKPDYERRTESGRAWDKEAKKQQGSGFEVGPDGKYEVKPGDSLWGIAERAIKKEGGKSSPAEVQKRVKELVEANKENLPGLDCNPHLLKRGGKLNIPGRTNQEQPSEKPAENPTPGNAAKPSEKPAENLTPGNAAKPSEKPAENLTPGNAAKPSDSISDKPSDKPGEAVRPADVCKPSDIYKDMAKFPELSPKEYFTACRISKAVIDGDAEALKRAMSDFPANKESGERVARALNETFRDQGIVVDYNQYNFFRASTPDKQETASSFRIYHRGAERYLEVGKDNVGMGGPVRQGPGGSIDYGTVAYHGETQRKATIDDLSAAMRRRYCP